MTALPKYETTAQRTARFTREAKAHWQKVEADRAAVRAARRAAGEPAPAEASAAVKKSFANERARWAREDAARMRAEDESSELTARDERDYSEQLQRDYENGDVAYPSMVGAWKGEAAGDEGEGF